MATATAVDPGGYRPGNRVRVLLGEAAALRGRVLSLLQARVLLHKRGLPSTSFEHLPGQVCVAVKMVGVLVPLSLDIAKIKLDALG